MRAIDHLTAAFLKGLDQFPDIQPAWVNLMYRLSLVAGPSHVSSIATAMRLDLLLRQIEKEVLEDSGPYTDKMLSLQLMEMIADNWLMALYEPIRAACELADKNDVSTQKLNQLHYRLAVVRIPIAKAEIKNAVRHKRPIKLKEIGPHRERYFEYKADGTYRVNRSVCTITGAVVWHPVDLKIGRTVSISRFDLSQEALQLFA